jgi:hypothetical protein
MAQDDYIIGAISCSDATAYSGSFIKLQGIGKSTEDNELCIIADIAYGQSANPEGDTTIQSYTGIVNLKVGDIIHGPIARFKTGTSTDGNGILAYYRKN